MQQNLDVSDREECILCGSSGDLLESLENLLSEDKQSAIIAIHNTPPVNSHRLVEIVDRMAIILTFFGISFLLVVAYPIGMEVLELLRLAKSF